MDILLGAGEGHIFAQDCSDLWDPAPLSRPDTLPSPKNPPPTALNDSRHPSTACGQSIGQLTAITAVDSQPLANP